jgi:hypothetical protein
MKKILAVMLAVVALAGVAVGDMDDKLYDLTAVGARTNSAAYVLRGRLEAVHIDVTAPATSTVTVASEDGRTLFTKSGIAADAVYLPVAATHTTAGAAATFNVYSNTAATTSEAFAQTWYGKQPMAEKITVTLVGQNGNAVTNNTKVRLVYER